MSDIIFTVFVPDGVELAIPQVMNMGLFAIFKGCESYSVTGGAEFRFDREGISKITTEQLGGLIQFGAAGVLCAGQIGPRYIEMTDEEYNGLVPVDFPESVKHVGVEPDITEMQMTFAEYCPWSQQSTDKSKWLVDLSERAEGESNGDGTSWDEFMIWFGKFGMQILSTDQANDALETYA